MHLTIKIIDLLVKNRLVTLTGAGGIGKTRLSIEAARAALSEFPDGVFFVALAPLPTDDSNLIARTVVQALGFVEVGNLPAEQQLREGIGNKRMLLVLDNCEHLIGGVAALASDLLSACPHIKIIATSRESLRIPGEWLYAVPTLGIVPEENMPLDLELQPALRGRAKTICVSLRVFGRLYAGRGESNVFRNLHWEIHSRSRRVVVG